MRKIATTLFACAVLGASPLGLAQLEHVEPPFWWAGMADPQLELMFHGPGIGTADLRVTTSGASLAALHRPANDNYLFATLDLSGFAAAGTAGVVGLQFTLDDQSVMELDYEIRARDSHPLRGAGFSPADTVYLIMPDRFANGNPDNDSLAGTAEATADRSEPYGRHGGDLAGIQEALPYLAGLGVTRLWLNPVLENDMPEASYHGYAATDMYAIDPRLGSNEQFRALSRAAAAVGIGLVWDAVPNHIGREHWWLADLPEPDWLHPLAEAGFSNHRREAVVDPHGVAEDLRGLTEGWFVEQMPDLDQDNPRLTRYLIQNAIWWVEFAGLAGIRVDTFPYTETEFLLEWMAALRAEYPDLSLVGEEWSYDPVITSRWQRLGTPSMMDFPVSRALRDGLGEESWDSGLNLLYAALTSDHLYPRPDALMIFADNHDMPRVHTALGDNEALTRMAVALVATLRGIPKMLYGTEILMTHTGDDSHGALRMDFPGGWPGDEVNAFTGEGLAPEVAAFQEWYRQLFLWRGESAAIAAGDLLHRVPVDGLYAFRRKAGDDHVLVIANNTAMPRAAAVEWLAPLLPEGVAARQWRAVPDGAPRPLAEAGDGVAVAPYSVLVLDDVPAQP